MENRKVYQTTCLPSRVRLKRQAFCLLFLKDDVYAKSDMIDKEYYERYYRDGVYYAATDDVPPLPSETSGNKLKALQKAPSVATKRASTLLRRSTTTSRGRGTPAPRCSETYNTHFP